MFPSWFQTDIMYLKAQILHSQKNSQLQRVRTCPPIPNNFLPDEYHRLETTVASDFKGLATNHFKMQAFFNIFT